MKESIKILVVPRKILFGNIIKPKDTAVLELEYEDEVLTFSLDGNELFATDFQGNAEDVFKRALEIWSSRK